MIILIKVSTSVRFQKNKIRKERSKRTCSPEPSIVALYPEIVMLFTAPAVRKEVLVFHLTPALRMAPGWRKRNVWEGRVRGWLRQAEEALGTTTLVLFFEQALRADWRAEVSSVIPSHLAPNARILHALVVWKRKRNRMTGRRSTITCYFHFTKGIIEEFSRPGEHTVEHSRTQKAQQNKGRNVYSTFN